MTLHTLRLRQNQDLRDELLAFAKKHHIKAGSVLTCVGSLKQAKLRMAGAEPSRQDVRTYKDRYEIVSLVGTLTDDNCHLHIAISDKNGRVVGGHLKEDTLVETTAEIVIVDDETSVYTRELDEDTGFTELVIAKK